MKNAYKLIYKNKTYYFTYDLCGFMAIQLMAQREFTKLEFTFEKVSRKTRLLTLENDDIIER